VVERVGDALVGPRPLGVIGFSEALPGVDHHLRMPEDPREYGRLLYAALHTLDELGCVRIVVEAVPEGAGWGAIRDRLGRAGRSSPVANRA
jgi:L-threonylcarbamoyladenylate synthase